MEELLRTGREAMMQVAGVILVIAIGWALDLVFYKVRTAAVREGTTGLRLALPTKAKNRAMLS